MEGVPNTQGAIIAIAAVRNAAQQSVAARVDTNNNDPAFFDLVGMAKSFGNNLVSTRHQISSIIFVN